jgi:hypothetical protein
MQRLLVLMISAILLFATGCTVVVHKQAYASGSRAYQRPTPYPTYQPTQESAPAPEYSSQQETTVVHVAPEPDVVIVTTEGPGQVYVEPEIVAETTIVIPGFWRPRARVGFSWISGNWQGTIYLPGFWRPVKKHSSGRVWVSGFWHHGNWAKGRWRLGRRTGYVWVRAHWNRQGEWIYGHWKPNRTRKNYVWVQGYWSPQNRWIAGRWRTHQKRNHLWISGRYDHRGAWVKAHWRKASPGKAWVKGYWNPRGEWAQGHWRENERSGFHYRQGRYDRQGLWTKGYWEPQKVKSKYGTEINQQPKRRSKVNETVERQQSIQYEEPVRTQRGRSKIGETVERQEGLKYIEEPEPEPEYKTQSGHKPRKSKLHKVVIKERGKKTKVIVKKKHKRGHRGKGKGHEYAEDEDEEVIIKKKKGKTKTKVIIKKEKGKKSKIKKVIIKK